jgi:uncharacterized protein YuzE
MELTYDQVVDALYVKLKDTTIIDTRTITASFNVDLDEFGQVVGVEVLNVRTSGIDPLLVILKHYTSDSIIEVPSKNLSSIARKLKPRVIALKNDKKLYKNRRRQVTAWIAAQHGTSYVNMCSQTACESTCCLSNVPCAPMPRTTAKMPTRGDWSGCCTTSIGRYTPL